MMIYSKTCLKHLETIIKYWLLCQGIACRPALGSKPVLAAHQSPAGSSGMTMGPNPIRPILGFILVLTPNATADGLGKI